MSEPQFSLTFDGIDDYIDIPYSEKLNPKLFTISYWAKYTGGKDDYPNLVCSRDSDPLRGYYTGVARAASSFYISVGPGKAGVPWEGFSASNVVLNTWKHVAITYDGSKLKMYVNGTAASEKAVTYAPNTRRPLRIGAGVTEGNAGNLFTGQIAEVCIWNKARTQEEIQADMNKRLTGKEEGLVGYWPLNEGSGNTVTDKTGNGQNGSIKGGATWQQEFPIKSGDGTYPTSGQFKVKTNSSTAMFVFANKQAKEVKYKFTPATGTWNPDPNKGKEFTAQGTKGLSDAEQKAWEDQLAPYKDKLKYPEKSPYALIAQLVSTNEEEENNETNVIEIGQATEILLGKNKALIFSVNDYVTEYTDNTGTLTVKWEALN